MLCIILRGILVFSGSGIEPDTFITHIVFFTQIINPAKSLSTAFYNAQRGSAAIKRIEDIVKAPIVVEEPANPEILHEFKDSTEFKNVSFNMRTQ